MKNWFIAAIVTGIVMLPMVIRKKKAGLRPIPVPTDTDKRYNVDDFLGEENL